MAHGTAVLQDLEQVAVLVGPERRGAIVVAPVGRIGGIRLQESVVPRHQDPVLASSRRLFVAARRQIRETRIPQFSANRRTTGARRR